MKNNLLAGVLLVLFVVLLSSCEHAVEMKTIVHADGSLDKTIVLESADSTLAEHNYLGIDKPQGWQVDVQQINDNAKSRAEKKKQDKKFLYTFKKSFHTDTEANDELAKPSDSLFRITSKFESRFRWFYTSMYYSDTYRAINRFDLSTEDYLTEEDFQFIDNLPAEGKSISKADSLFLIGLNERIFDHYGNRAYFDEHYKILTDLIKDDPQREKLQAQHEAIFQSMDKRKDIEEDFLPKLADSLGVSIDFTSAEYKKRKLAAENKLKFASWAAEGKYRHVIEMPNEIVAHNADSVRENTFYWSPSYLKFLFRDYTFFAETRKPNIWAWVVSLIVLILAALGLIKKGK
ncbi:MAG: hypothetical protein ACKVOQ_07710 [Cyclobacteriaceae bacterium]